MRRGRWLARCARPAVPSATDSPSQRRLEHHCPYRGKEHSDVDHAPKRKPALEPAYLAAAEQPLRQLTSCLSQDGRTEEDRKHDRREPPINPERKSRARERHHADATDKRKDCPRHHD